MSGRVAALGGPIRPVYTPGAADVLTPGLVDRAVDKVLEGEDPELKRAIADLWGNDQSSEVAQMLNAAALAQTTRQQYSAAGKTRMVVYSALKPDEVKVLSATHPDYDFSYKFSATAEHGLGATVRKAGSARKIGNIPVGMRYADFGGSLLDHVESADINCVVVSKVIDTKDPMRAVLTRRRLSMLATEGIELTAHKDRVTRDMARSVLAGEGKYHVESDLESFSQQIPAGIMVHVYDVPIAQLPLMMERCGMLVLEGTLHFSNRFFLEDAGELPDIGARFEVNRKLDVFSMGFVGSSVMWYKHKWSEFRRYGADQVLNGKKHKYSYKIVERRGDTIDFRVLRVGGKAQPEVNQYYAVPGVPMIEVEGYAVSKNSNSLTPDTRRFPVLTWEYMVRQAAVEAAKGTLDYNSHAGAYLTITAGDTYNGTSASIGRVPPDDLPALVVWSAVYGLGEIMLLRKGVKTMVDLEMSRRNVLNGSLLAQGIEIFSTMASAVVGSRYMMALRTMCSWDTRDLEGLSERILRVRPVPRLVQVPADVLEGKLPDMPGSTVARFVHAEHMSKRVAYDDMLLDVAERVKTMQKVERDKGVTTLDGDVVDGATVSETLVEPSGPPPWMPIIPKWEEYRRAATFHTEEDMRAAVKEEIQLCEEETEKLEAFFTERYAKAVRGAEVDKFVLDRNAEAWRDADFWWVEDNIVVRSVLGRRVEDFDYGGLFVPVPMRVVDVTGRSQTTYLRSVAEHEWSGTDPVTRLLVSRTHWKLDGEPFTGWAMSNRELSVFNGRQIIAGLQVALRCSYRFQTGCYIGGPGAGKTTQIVSQFKVTDFVTSPLVKSVEDTRGKLVKAKRCTFAVAKSRCRTNDSLLVLVGKHGRIPAGFPTADMDRADEIYNGRCGRALACAALLGVKVLLGYGDPRQIPPVVRADSVPVFSKFQPEHIVERKVVFRGAPAILSCFNGHYDNKLRTLNTKEGVVAVVKSMAGVVPAGDYLLICMNQSDKKVLHNLFPQAGARIKTTHEAQGGEADEIWLFCLSTYKRPEDDLFHLYNVAEYVNVAISRARTKFSYVNLSPNKDKVEQWIERGMDPVLIAEAKYVSD